MDTSLFKFTELAKSLRDRGNIVSIDEIPSQLAGHSREAFVNTLLFDANFLAYTANTQTVSGYRGAGYMPRFPIDFDGTISTARKSVLDFIEGLALNGVDVDKFLYFFSGNKGFHVMIPNAMIGSFPNEDISRIMRKFAEMLLDGIDYDPTIYNHVRLFRLKNTVNEKSGLYKVQLTYKEMLLLADEDILEIAKAPRKMSIAAESVQRSQYLVSLWEYARSNLKSRFESVAPAEENAEFKQVCYRNIFSNGAKDGNRNNVTLRAAWILKKHSGMPFDIVLDTLKKWNETRNTPPLSEEELTNTVAQAFRGSYHFGCSDHVLESYCDDNCPIKKKYLHRLEENEALFQNISSIGSAYLNFVDTYHKNRLGFGHHSLDNHLRGLLPSTLAYILARSGVGKTSFIVDSISRITTQWNVPIVLFSLEMSKEMIFERMLARFANINFSQIPEFAKDAERFNQNLVSMQKFFRKLVICDKPALTIEAMEKYAQEVENSIIGEKIRVVFIDYLGLIRSDKSSEYERVSSVAYDIQAWAKRSKTTIVILTQTGRERGGSGATELELDAGRGSGVIEETADFMLGLWRSSGGSSEDIFLKILKNRYGKSNISYTCDVSFEKQKWDLHENVSVK